MKKILFLLLAVCTSAVFVANAQTTKGNVMVGGDIANLHWNLTKGGSFSILVDPKAAWFVQDNVAFGGYVLLGLNFIEGPGTDVRYGAGALGRYYAGGRAIENVRRTRFFGEVSAGLEGDHPANAESTIGLAMGVGPGLAYFITPSIGLEGLLKFKNIVGFGSAASTSQLNFNLGFQVYIPRSTARSAVDNVINN